MCYSATDGFAWVATCQFVITFIAMILLTARVGFYEIEICETKEEEEEEEEEEETTLGQDHTSNDPASKENQEEERKEQIPPNGSVGSLEESKATPNDEEDVTNPTPWNYKDWGATGPLTSNYEGGEASTVQLSC
jgi:hypothetical protein